MTERVEAFTPDHLDECARLLIVAFNVEPWNARYTFEAAKRELSWNLEVPGHVGLVSATDRVVALATGYIEPDDERNVFYLKTFCVEPEAQGTGVGRRLLERLEERLEKTGVNKVYLITHRGTPAESFYRKYGYEVKDADIVMTHEW